MRPRNFHVAENNRESGFTLIEMAIAMIVLMIGMLGALQAINYSILYNAGNANRAQSLAILQQEVERLRAAKFTPAGMDAAALPGTGACRADAQRDISGGAKTPCTLTAPNGTTYVVRTWVDDDPFNTAARCVDDTTTCNVDNTTRIKEITVRVQPAPQTSGWQIAVPAQVTLRRTIGN